ncbi:hypothetical protein OAN21_01550 [Alphaproteobacteria bacterium]|nr:hypothetical protein [Alphaproteobacteria bacterium]
MKLGYFVFLFVFVFSDVCMPSAEDREIVPTSLFKATTANGREVFLLGTNHFLSIELEPSVILEMLGVIKEKKPLLVSESDPTEEDMLPWASERANLGSSPCAADLKTDFGSELAFKGAKERHDLCLQNSSGAMALLGLDGQKWAEVHPAPLFMSSVPN